MRSDLVYSRGQSWITRWEKIRDGGWRPFSSERWRGAIAQVSPLPIFFFLGRSFFSSSQRAHTLFWQIICQRTFYSDGGWGATSEEVINDSPPSGFKQRSFEVEWSLARKKEKRFFFPNLRKNSEKVKKLCYYVWPRYSRYASLYSSLLLLRLPK